MDSRVGWKTWSAFALVLAGGGVVFALLPSWVREHPPAEIPPAPPATRAPVATPPEAILEEPTSTPPTSTVVVSEVAPGPSFEAPAELHDDGFASAMTEAFDALKREDYPSAREAFERAKVARPESPEVASGLSQVEEGVRNLTIAGHRDRAREHEGDESWRKAEAEYDAALALAPSLRFAQEGKTRTAARALLQEKLEYHINHPERLSDARAHEEASRLLDEARSADGDSAKRRDAVAKLEALLNSYAKEVEVAILSDNMTEVTLQRVGPLGKFERKVLQMRPGRYVAIGSRAGFRDVRVEFMVEPGRPAVPVSVRCQEAI